MIKWSDDYPGEWRCDQCGAHGWMSGDTEQLEREHKCEPKPVRVRRNPAGTVDRESDLQLSVR